MKKNYTLSISVRGFWQVFVPALALFFLGGIIGGVILVDRVIMPRIVDVSNKGIVEIPQITGLTWEDARQKLYNVGLRLTVGSREYNEDMPQGTVLMQRPEPGEQVKKGRHVNVTLSKGAEVASMPAVKEQTERQARKILREAGFTNVIVHREFDDDIEKDLTIETEPAGGTITSREVPVVLKLSRGPKPTHAVVPNIVGEMLSEGQVKIEESGLVVGNITYKRSEISRSGVILSQSLSPGTSAPLSTQVNLVVATSQ